MQSVNKITPVLIPTRAYICAECGGYVHTHNVCVGAGHSYGMMLRSVEAMYVHTMYVWVRDIAMV